MNNKAFSKIWLIIILVVLITGGIFAWQYFGAPKEEAKAPEEMVEEKKRVQNTQEEMEFCEGRYSYYANEDDRKMFCYLDLAKEKKDETYCEKIEDNLYRSDCYEDLAVIKEDETLCDKIPSHLLKISRPSCYANVALKKNDETICSKLRDSEENGSCYTRFASERKDESFCKNIIEIKNRDTCYYSLAYQLEDALICEKISGLENRDDCYSKLALILKDPTICNKAENPLIKCKKYFEVMALDSSDWNTYTNKEDNFEFRIAPIFEEVGYEIIEAKSSAIFLDGECNVISFKTHPIEPYWGSTDKSEFEVFMPLYLCPKEYCHKNEEGRQFCEALREGRDETESGDWIFANFVSENEDFIVYEEGGPSKGDVYDALGWNKGEVLGAKDKILSTFRFLE